MKIIISNDELKKGLSLVERICAKNLVLPILNNVLLSADEATLKLTTTNLEIAIIHYCLAKIEEKGEITVPVRTLSNLISFLETPKISLQTKGKILNISNKEYQVQIKGMDPKDFPIIPRIEKTQSLELNPSPLCEGILEVIDFCATGQARPELSGIFFLFERDQLKIVATDSFRLAEKTLFFEEPKEDLKEKSFILPRGAARELVNIFSDKREKMKLFISSGQVMFESYFEGTKNPQSQLISRLIEGDFPEYQAVVPKTYHTQILVAKNQFLNRIKTVSIFSGSGNEIFLTVDPKKKKIEISAKSGEIGQANVEIPAEIRGEKVKTCFNWRFLVEGISKIKEDEIIFELNQEGGPGVLKPRENQDFLYILMPIKQT